MNITETVSSTKAPVFLLPAPYWLFPVSPLPRPRLSDHRPLFTDHCFYPTPPYPKTPPPPSIQTPPPMPFCETVKL
jgi:hypothetical protein